MQPITTQARLHLDGKPGGDVDNPVAATPEPGTALPTTNVINQAPRLHPAHWKSVSPEPPPTSHVTFSEIYLDGGMVSPALLPLQQAPTCRVPPLPTQYVFNLNPNSIYYADGSITSHIKYGALVFCFLLSELLSSWTHPLHLLFPWHPRSN